MNRLRSRLVLAFLLATLAPLGVTLWITTSLLERSLSLSSTREIEELSRALEKTGREFYRQSREMLRADAAAGKVKGRRFPVTVKEQWPSEVVSFWDSGQPDRFELAGELGGELLYLVRSSDAVTRYSRNLGAVRMNELTALYAKARARVDSTRTRDFRRGFLYALLLLAATVGALSIAVILFFAHRISRPVHRLTEGLRRLAEGDMSVRLQTGRKDEIGAALEAFNHMAEELQHSRERLVLLTRLSSWQALGRKMAHEVKNSLTPIRLTVEEMVARQGDEPARKGAFFEQAAQIVVDEVNRLERRVRAFSDLAAEPPVNSSVLDLNAVVEERIGFLGGAHSGVVYRLRLAAGRLNACGDEDLVRGILTNLLENAAEAAGAGGVVVCSTLAAGDGKVWVEVHDSGPGLSALARETLFEPTISFKKAGMGIGLSIARKSALLSGGDISLIDGELGGAAFRLILPAAATITKPHKDEEVTWAHHGS